MNYSYKKKLDISFEDAISRAKESLAKQGFGILTEINVKNTLKDKLNVDYDNYIILGACNPPNAYKALQVEKEMGLLLPCNVIVYEEDAKVFVSAILPTVAMSIVEKPGLDETARLIEAKLKKAIDTI